MTSENDGEEEDDKTFDEVYDEGNCGDAEKDVGEREDNDEDRGGDRTVVEDENEEEGEEEGEGVSGGEEGENDDELGDGVAVDEDSGFVIVICGIFSKFLSTQYFMFLSFGLFI